MKTVVLLRHAEAEWHAPDGSDVARPLTERGRSAAGVMGRFLRDGSRAPDLAVTSPAVRARETLRIAAEAGEWRCPLQTRALLYEARPGDVFAVLGEVDDAVDTVLLVGHQPTWSTVLQMIVGGGNMAMPPAAAAAVDLDVSSWKRAGPETGTLAFLVPPEVLGSER